MLPAEGRERKARGYPLARGPAERKQPDRHSRAMSESEDRRFAQKRERERLKQTRRGLPADLDDDDGGFLGPAPKDNPANEVECGVVGEKEEGGPRPNLKNECHRIQRPLPGTREDG